MTKEASQCKVCQTRELDQLKQELSECKKRNASKERSIKKLNKQLFTLTIVAVAIGAIFGKETLDSITEWLNSVSSFKSSAEQFQGYVVPAPGSLPLIAMTLLITKPTRRR